MTTTVEETNLTEQLAALRGDFAHLGTRIRAVAHRVDCPLTGVKLRLHHPTFADGQPTIHDLALALTYFMTYFALHRTECDRVDRLYGKVPTDKYNLEYAILQRKARETFKKAHRATNRNGEAGELLLFLLTEWQLGAPQILAKMGLKTNPAMPVHGADGVHARFDEERERLIFYLGESKIYAGLNAALSASADSIATALQPKGAHFELELVASHIPLSGLTKKAQEALLEYLHPFSAKRSAVETVITCLICYNESAYAQIETEDSSGNEKEFTGLITSKLSKVADDAAKYLAAAGVTNKRIELFLLPVPSVADFRDLFQSEIGWSM